MVGVVAPSQADSVFALVDLLQKPELQDRLRQFKEAEAAALAAQRAAEVAKQEAEVAKVEAEKKIAEWIALERKVNDFIEMQKKHVAWVDGINKAIGAKG